MNLMRRQPARQEPSPQPQGPDRAFFCPLPPEMGPLPGRPSGSPWRIGAALVSIPDCVCVKRYQVRVRIRWPALDDSLVSASLDNNTGGPRRPQPRSKQLPAPSAMFRWYLLPPPIPEQTLVPAAVTAGTLECMTADSAPTSSAARSMRSPACGKSKYQPERPAAAPEAGCPRSAALTVTVRLA